MPRDPILPLDELIRIRSGGDRDESSRQTLQLLRKDGRRISLHDDGGAPHVPVNLQEPRDITKGTTMVTPDVGIERVIDPRQRMLAESRRDVSFSDPEIVSRRRHV